MVLELLALVAAGPTEQKPDLLCGEQTAFALAPKEKLKSVSLGIHIGTAEIETPRGELVIREGNAWAEPKSFEEEVWLDSGVRMVMTRPRGSSRKISYAVYGRLDGTEWGDEISRKERVVAWISGGALQGNDRDDAILERVRVVPFDKAECSFHMDYGWDQILGEE